MSNLRLAEAGSVVLEGQLILDFVDMEATQAIGVRELAEMAQLFFCQRGLQFVSDFHECHCRIISADVKISAFRM